MQAHGHEFIEKHLSLFMEEIIKKLFSEDDFKGVKNIIQHQIKNNGIDELGRVMYMGNWITDNSQLFAPDFFFDFKFNLPQYLDKVIELLEVLKSQFEDIVGKKLAKNVSTQMKFFVDHAKEVQKNLRQDRPNPNEFKYAKKDSFWEVVQSIIKMRAYRKFCMVDKNPISDETFISIISSFIDQNTEDQSDYKFKLNQYYPNDHLDRNFDIDLLKYERRKQHAANEWLKRQPKSKSKLEEKLKIDEFNKKGSQRRNCFDSREITNNAYGFLNRYVEIIGNKLNYLNRKLIIPYFIKGSKLPNNSEFMVLCSQLGHSLHGVEDFFAHSNYIELAVQNLDKLRDHEQLAKEKYFSNVEFVELLKSYPFEHERFDRSKWKPIRNLNDVTQIEENNLTTGIFAETDTLTSIYHMTFDRLEEELNHLKNEGNFTDDPATAVLQYAITSLNEYIKLLENWPANVDQKYRIKSGLEKKFNKEILKFILNLNPEFKKVKSTNQRKFENHLDNVVDILNSIYQACVPLLIVKDNAIIVLKFMQVILVFCFLPLILIMFVKGLLVNGMTNYAIAIFLQQFLDRFANHIEHQVLNINNSKMWGTHSLLAKDEAFRNKIMNHQALRMALFMDEFILVTMLIGSDIKNEEQVDMVKLLKKYLKHPCPDNNRTKQELSQELKRNGTNSVIYVIDSVTKNIAPVNLNGIIQSGWAGTIKGVSFDMFNRRFFEYNGEVLKKEYLKIPNLTLDKVPISSGMQFQTIILPYQNEEREIRYVNGNTSVRRILREVVITANAPINPNKLWKIQFFNKSFFEKEKSRNILNHFFDLLNKTDDMKLDEVFLEKDRLLFGDDKVPLSLIENTPKIKLNEVQDRFELEIEMKREYEVFIEEFIKIHYS